MPTPNIEELIDAVVSKAIAQAWQLGQAYWQQADSDYPSQHKKADVTRAKFSDLLTLARQAIAGALQSQAERIKKLEAEIKCIAKLNLHHFNGWGEADKRISVLHTTVKQITAERDTLRAQLAEIKKTEPVAWQHVFTNGRSLSYSETVAGFPAKKDAEKVEPLFTRPMPAQKLSEAELWKSDEIMAINAELGLPMNLLKPFVQAILKVANAKGAK